MLQRFRKKLSSQGPKGPNSGRWKQSTSKSYSELTFANFDRSRRTLSQAIKNQFPSTVNTYEQPLQEIHIDSFENLDERAINKLKRAQSDSILIDQNLKEKMYKLKTTSISYEDFTFMKLIGKGGYGKVYLVVQKATKDVWAMKVLRFEACVKSNVLESLKNEINVLKMIKGEYLAKAYYSFLHDNSVCIVMEYAVGGDFRSRLKDEGRFSVEVAQFYAAELVLALENLHQLKLIHRDLKPENLLINAEGHLILADFGLSEILDKYNDL